MRTRLLRLTALSIGGFLALAGDLPHLDDSGSFAAGFSWITAAHAEDADVGGGNGENGAGGSNQGGENGESGASISGDRRLAGSGGRGSATFRGPGGGSVQSNGAKGGGEAGTGDGGGTNGEPVGTGAGGGGGAVGLDGERRSLSRDSRDYGPTGSVWHGGSSFLNLFRRTPEEPAEGSGPESSTRQKSGAGTRRSAVHTKTLP